MFYLVVSETDYAPQPHVRGLIANGAVRRVFDSSSCAFDQIDGIQRGGAVQHVLQQLAQLAQPGDLILTVGAGDIYLAGEALARYQD